MKFIIKININNFTFFTNKNYSVIIHLMDEFEYLEKSKNEIITIDNLNKKNDCLSDIYFLTKETKILF